MFLFFIATFYLNETFPNQKAENEWDIAFNVTECYASSHLLHRYCGQISSEDEILTTTTKLQTTIEHLPFLTHFTAKTRMPTTPSNITFSLLSSEGTEISLNLEYTDDDPIYSFTASEGNVTTGFISHERELTNSLTLSVRDDETYVFYVNGLILHIGNLSKPFNFPITDVQVTLKNGNTTSEIGNIYITDDLSLRYDLLIQSLLQLRPCERAVFIKELVDEEEMRLFDGLPLDEPIDKNDEYGIPLDEKTADPRSFSFPLTLKSSGEKQTTTQQKQSPESLEQSLHDGTADSRPADKTEKAEIHINQKKKAHNEEL